MSLLTRRLQVLVEPEQYDRLERSARSRGVSVGEAVRDAIDRVARSAPELRRAALARPLAAEPVDLPEDVADLSLYPLSSADTLGFIVTAHRTTAYWIAPAGGRERGTKDADLYLA